jgi:hypothetical protein
MSLLDTASLLLTPNAYKEGKLYSVIPSDGSGDFTFTRATTATRVNSDGLVELVPYNLFSYSEQFDNAAWTKSASGTGVIPVVTANYGTAPNGTLTADRVEINSNAAGLSQIAQTFTGPINTIGTFSIWMKSLTSNVTVTMFVGSTTGNKTVTTEWQRFTFSNTSLASINDARIAKRDVWGSSGNADLLLWGAQVVEGTNELPYLKTETRLNIPRIDYSLGGCPNILLEPQRTNLLQRSEEFNNAYWNKNGGSISANSSTAPNGTTTADRLTLAATTATHGLIDFGVGGVAASTYTVSFYVKKGTHRYITIGIYRNTLNNAGAGFDLDTNTVTGTGATGTGYSASGATMTDVGDGWYRCSVVCVSGTTPMTGSGLFLRNTSYTSGAIQESWAASGTETINLWGAQAEVGAYATSYIPTTTASVTRNRDELTQSNIYTNGLITASGGTWFVDFRNNVPLTRDAVVRFGLGDTSAISLNSIYFIGGASNGRLIIQNRVAGLTTTLYTTTTDTCKIAFKWNGATMDVFENGFKVIADSVFTSTDLNFFNGVGQTPYFISSMLLAPTPLTDAECIQLTTL